MADAGNDYPAGKDYLEEYDPAPLPPEEETE